MQVPPPPPGFGAPSLQGLPDGWTEHAAPNGQPYYYHAASTTSTYVRPVHAPQAAPGSAIPPPPPGFSQEAAQSPVTDGTKEQKKKKKKEKPVEKLAIPGTPWLKVTTNENNVFYTNTETKTSVWTIPEEIREQVEELERSKVDEKARKEEEEAHNARMLLLEKEEEMKRLKEELEQEREASRKRKVQEEEEEAEHAAAVARQQQDQASAAKRAKVSNVKEAGEASDQQNGEDSVTQEEQEGQNQEQVEDEPEPEEELQDWEKDELKAKAELEKELETPGPSNTANEQYSSEEGIALFKTMLAEKDINPMRPWDMELPKFIGDPRYKAVKTLRERHDLFDEHCKHMIREKRAKKAASGQTKQDPASAYRALLVAEVTSTRTKWDDFKSKHKKDARFRDFGRDDRERERAFRVWLRELGEIKRADAQKAEEKFVQMLQEKTLPDGSTWSEVKGKLSSDPRYAAVASSSQREEIFKKHLETRKASSSAQQNANPEEAKRKAAEERKAKQAASLREREEKVRRDKAALDRATGKSRADAGREGSEREFKSLLIDAVRDHDASWSDLQPTLQQDPRYNSSTLSSSEKKRMFEDHQNELYDKRTTAVESLFASHAKTLTTPFDTVYSKIQSDPTVTRMKMSEDRMKRLYEEWSRRRYSQAKKDFETLLSESNFVEYWGRLKQESASKEDEHTKELLGNTANGGDGEDEDGGMNVEEAVDLKTMAAQIDIKELQAVLKHDKRYAIFDYDPELRERWIQEHITNLGRPKQTVHQH